MSFANVGDESVYYAAGKMAVFPLGYAGCLREFVVLKMMRFFFPQSLQLEF